MFDKLNRLRNLGGQSHYGVK